MMQQQSQVLYGGGEEMYTSLQATCQNLEISTSRQLGSAPNLVRNQPKFAHSSVNPRVDSHIALCFSLCSFLLAFRKTSGRGLLGLR